MANSIITIFQNVIRKKDLLAEERQELIKAADNVRRELNLVHNRLNYTTEPLLIESIIYEIKSLQKKYEYYIRLCKEKGFAADGFKRVS